jgi:alkylation response protein AidB-like acyl-CoA dehydrogenase
MFDPPPHEGPLLELGFRGLTASLLTGLPLGVARRALDEVLAAAPRKRRPNHDETVAENAHAQLQIGRAEGALQSARALAVEAFGSAWATILAEGTSTALQRSRLLLATQQAMEAALFAVDVAHRLVGSSAVYQDDPIGRCFRDLHVARQHIIFSGDLLAEYARDRMADGQAVGERARVARRAA